MSLMKNQERRSVIKLDLIYYTGEFMNNKNFFSLIKNSEVTYTSCLKTDTVKGHNDVFYTEDRTLEMTHQTKKVCGSFENCTVLKNISDENIDINQISSAFVEIKNEGQLKWYDENKYKIYFCQSAWLGEGQWDSRTLDDLGLYQVYDGHWMRHYASISSKGSWSTALYYPLVMVEDLELKKIHYFEIKSSASWYIELCIGYDEKRRETLYVFASDSCEKNDGWHKDLKPGESYKTAITVYGTVDGSFEEAVKRLTDYKRADSRVHFENDIPPVCFNDYMNCCWAMPSYEKTIALIDKAAELGAEIFCIDDGWQTSLIDDSIGGSGDWVASKSKFAPKTFEEIVEYINSKGMKCGAWLEIESVAEGSKGYAELDKYILKRRGHNIGKDVCFYDFRTEFIQNKLEKVFDMLYEMGVRYIKNDYNKSIGVGCDGVNSLSEEMRENLIAFCEFIDKIQEKYPDLIIENCGSGGMRCDSETLSHFHLQSTSDQEVYTCYPSIICGSLAYMPVEKAGIWSYPYPVRYADRMRNKIFEDDYSNGHQTAFNMINSMMGLMYLSGRVDAADELNEKLIKDAIKIYKNIRADYTSAYPIYPTGTFRLKNKGIFTLGLYVPEKNIAYLAIWKINTNDSKLTVDLSKYGKIKKVDKTYPELNNYTLSCLENEITAEFPNANCAMFVKIEFETGK